MSSKPLSGVRIIDLTRIVSGPFATMQLGDLGADVIKIEEPLKGDESRAFGPPFLNGESSYFLSVNRNKRSCAINLKTGEGRALLLHLVSKADVIIENFRPGAMERLGLEYEKLTLVNPSIIHCSITGFGSNGPDSERPGYDLILQGEAGLMDITGETEGPPMKVGTSIGDLVTGLYATQGILAAITERDRTGLGTTINISMLDSLASLLTFNAGIYFATGKSPTRRGNEHPTIAPYETFEASDGWINLGIANDKFWRLFCTSIEMTSLADDPRFLTAPDRVRHKVELKPLVADIIRMNTREYWIKKLGEVGVPCGAIRTIKEVCEAEQLVSRDMIIRMNHPTAGEIRNIDSPIRFNDTNNTDDQAPPLLGQHTFEILHQVLGMEESDIKELESKQIIRCAKIATS